LREGVKVKVAFGLKAHSGWAALVVLGAGSSHLEVVDRRRVELVQEDEAEWARQPYHAAKDLDPRDARELVQRGLQAARRNATREMRAGVRRAQEGGHEVTACAVLMGEPMPDWSVEEILAVHFRMHKAEGVLFREALARAATECDLRLVTIPEKQLSVHAGRALTAPLSILLKRVAALGKSVGPPWGKDQKDAALAAMIALQGLVK
jgi:hypothetical protein